MADLYTPYDVQRLFDVFEKALSETPITGTVTGTVTANAGTNLNTGSLALEAGGNLASVKTNTDPLVAAAAGGYIRQDSTATIAKETGGNLATLTAKDFATQTTLALVAKEATLLAVKVRQELSNVEFSVNSSGTLLGRTAKYFTVLGGRSQGWNSTTLLGDCCDYLDTTQDLMNTPTSQQLYIVSTDADDIAGGAGVRTIRVVYLDDAGAITVATYTMDGTTPVAAMADAIFILWMESATVGVTTVAEGNIAISSTNGAATTATTFDLIRAGGNRSLSGRFKVPTGWTGYLVQWHGSAISATMDTRVRGDWFADDGALSEGVFHFKDRRFLASGDVIDGDLHFLKVPAGGVVKISAIPGSAPAGNKLDASFDIIIISDT